MQNLNLKNLKVNVHNINHTNEERLSVFLRPYLQYCFCEKPLGLLQLMLLLYLLLHFLFVFVFIIYYLIRKKYITQLYNSMGF
jgi:hypothetical protein